MYAQPASIQFELALLTCSNTITFLQGFWIEKLLKFESFVMMVHAAALRRAIPCRAITHSKQNTK